MSYNFEALALRVDLDLGLEGLSLGLGLGLEGPGLVNITAEWLSVIGTVRPCKHGKNGRQNDEDNLNTQESC